MTRGAQKSWFSPAKIALTDSSQTVPPDAPSLEEATANTPDPELDNLPRTIGTLEINEECLVAEICIDRYLWALYERAPKVDAIKVHEQRKVKIKRKLATETNVKGSCEKVKRL